jgi:hypothetical protein
MEAMLSPAEIATIRAEIERLEEALKNCYDNGLRRWIEAVIENQKKKLASLEQGQKSVQRNQAQRR